MSASDTAHVVGLGEAIAGTDPRFPTDEALTPARARELGHELGLRGDEYDRIVATLGRTPSVSELGMYSVMWSEHCSYKSSKIHLRNLPTEGPQVLVGPGENAGVVDVGGELAVTFKIESHNHPSYVEPYQGATTGVGGIIRDILTMGARPVAVMDPLRFGLPDDDRTRRIVDGVVRGVGGYGNCVGVPNIGGETVFDASYQDNPLVNVLCIGVLPKDRLQLAVAENVGDVAVLLGSATGRDGIGGASVLASQEFDDELEGKRPNVQVGDPFAEKLLIECCLELYDAGLLSGIQDMGAAGIACSTAEMASKASLGMRVDLDRVHLREPSMESWEILCSESQERMLALVAPDQLDTVLAVAQRWGVPASAIGEVVGGRNLELWRRGEVVADFPARSLADEGPTYDRPQQRPDLLDQLAAVDADATSLDDVVRGLAPDAGPIEACLAFLGDPNLASARWVHQQYDHLVGSGTVLGPGDGDAGVIRLPGSDRAVACATDGNGRACAVDPVEGTRRVVAEAHRNVACVGARPLASTNCLNFGNPEKPTTMWVLAASIAAMGEACAALDVPITGGNVSLYNETLGEPIHPTPVMGVLGVLDDARHAVGSGFVAAGDVVVVLGAPTRPGLAASELQHQLGRTGVAPALGGVLAPVDLELEVALGRLLPAAAASGLLRSAHDVAGGGLLAALAESCAPSGLGVRFAPEPAEEGSTDRGSTDRGSTDRGSTDRGSTVTDVQLLFSESPGRVVVSVAPDAVAALEALADDHGVALRRAGMVGGPDLVVDGVVALPVADVVAAREATLPRLLDDPTVRPAATGRDGRDSS